MDDSFDFRQNREVLYDMLTHHTATLRSAALAEFELSECSC